MGMFVPALVVGPEWVQHVFGPAVVVLLTAITGGCGWLGRQMLAVRKASRAMVKEVTSDTAGSMADTMDRLETTVEHVAGTVDRLEEGQAEQRRDIGGVRQELRQLRSTSATHSEVAELRVRTELADERAEAEHRAIRAEIAHHHPDPNT